MSVLLIEATHEGRGNESDDDHVQESRDPHPELVVEVPLFLTQTVEKESDGEGQCLDEKECECYCGYKKVLAPGLPVADPEDVDGHQGDQGNDKPENGIDHHDITGVGEGRGVLNILSQGVKCYFSEHDPPIQSEIKSEIGSVQENDGRK